MKLHTQVAVAIRFVGDAKAQPFCFEGAVFESIKFIGETLVRNSMKTRFDISVARTKQEALDGVNRRSQLNGVTTNDTEDLDSLWAALQSEPQADEEENN